MANRDSAVTISRKDLLLAFVLNEVSDGYKEFEQVARESSALAGQFGLTLTQDTVRELLTVLIGSALVKAVWLSSREPPRVVDGVPAENDFMRVYFFQTEEGKDANAENFWPFDDDGNIIPNLTVVP
jgi:hypothetical protein